MGFPLSLEQQEYEALIALSRAGAKDAEGNTDLNKLRDIDSFLKAIEKKNGIVRSALWIQWQETDQPLPPTTNFPEVWPPELRFYLELVTRPIAKADVMKVLEVKARKPLSVLVTKDPAAQVGWTELDTFFVT